jgi:hypothetical protein
VWKETKIHRNSFHQRKVDKRKIHHRNTKYLARISTIFAEKNENNQYVHRSLRSALFGIKLALPYLFTYQDFPELKIPNTTNHVDGGVNTKLKELNRQHRGMRRDRRNKLLVRLLYNLKSIQ